MRLIRLKLQFWGVQAIFSLPFINLGLKVCLKSFTWMLRIRSNFFWILSLNLSLLPAKILPKRSFVPFFRRRSRWIRMMGLTDLEYRLLCISDRWSMTLKVEKVKLILCLCALSLSSKGNPYFSYLLNRPNPYKTFRAFCTFNKIFSTLYCAHWSRADYKIDSFCNSFRHDAKSAEWCGSNGLIHLL